MSSVANVSGVVCSFPEEGLTLGALEIHFKRGGTLFFFFFLLLLNSQKDPEIRKNYQLAQESRRWSPRSLGKVWFFGWSVEKDPWSRRVEDEIGFLIQRRERKVELPFLVTITWKEPGGAGSEVVVCHFSLSRRRVVKKTKTVFLLRRCCSFATAAFSLA